MNQKNSVSLVTCNFVGFHHLDSSCRYNSIIIVRDVVRFYEKFLPMNTKDPLTSCILYFIFIYERIDVVRSLEHKIRFKTTNNLIFFKENHRTFSNIYTITEGLDNPVHEDIGMCSFSDFNSH